MGDKTEQKKSPDSLTTKTQTPLTEEQLQQADLTQSAGPDLNHAGQAVPPEALVKLHARYGNQTVQRMIAEGTIKVKTPPPSLNLSILAPAEPTDQTDQAQPEIQHTHNAPQNQRFLGGALQKGAAWALEKAMQAAGIPAKLVMGFLKKAGGVFMTIVKNPAAFLSSLINGFKQGFTGFVSNITKYLKAGFLSWLFGALAQAGLQIPESFSLQSILSMVMQILGITAQAIKTRLAKFIGEKNMARIEKAWEIISSFISNGLGGLWDKIKEYVGNLKEMVVDEIKNWVIVEVIKNAVFKLLSMFNPVSGLVSVVKMIYNVIKFIMQRGQQIAGLVAAVVESVAAIASGNISAMAQKIEQALARAIPVVLGFMMSLLGLGGITNKVRQVVQKIQKKIQDAIDKMIEKVAAGVKKLFGRSEGGKDGKDAQSGDKQTQVKAGFRALKEQQHNYRTDGKMTQDGAQKLANTIKQQHPVFATLKATETPDKWRYDYTLIQRDDDNEIPKGATRPDEIKDIKTPKLDELETKELGVTQRYVREYKAYTANGGKQLILIYLEGRAARKLGRGAEGNAIADYAKVSGGPAFRNNRTIEILHPTRRNVLGERIPDIFGDSVVGDVKHEKSVHFTPQMQDNYYIAQGFARIKGEEEALSPGRRFDLIVRAPSDENDGKGTHVSGPLRDAITATGGEIYEIIG